MTTSTPACTQCTLENTSPDEADFVCTGCGHAVGYKLDGGSVMLKARFLKMA